MNTFPLIITGWVINTLLILAIPTVEVDPVFAAFFLNVFLVWIGVILLPSESTLSENFTLHADTSKEAVVTFFVCLFGISTIIYTILWHVFTYIRGLNRLP